MRLVLSIVVFVFSASVLSAQTEGAKVWRILDAYGKNYGAGRDAKQMSAVLIEGQQTQGDQVFDFAMRKKAPHSIRYQMSSGGNSIVYGYNGRIGWERVAHDGQVTIRELSGDELAVVMEEAEFEGALLRYLRLNDGQVTYVGADRVKDEQVHVLKVTRSSGRQSVYYISQRSYYLLKREQLDQSGEVALTTLYSDYRKVHDIPFAHVVETYSGEELVSRVDVRDIKVNPGVLSFYFEKPAN